MAKYRKFYAAAMAAAGVFTSSQLLTGTTETVVETIVAMVGAAAVYLFPNEEV